MIQAKELTMNFDKFVAVDKLNCEIKKGCIYGLIGSNGAGKSTFLRLITGIYKPASGSVTLDGETIFNNPAVKNKFAFVPDELYFLTGASMKRMSELYGACYPNFSKERFLELSSLFGLDIKKNISSFSKGMKRQAATILMLSTMADYFFFDETFDGLDPVMRNLVKKVIYNDVCDRQVTAVITSHSLRELEDTCDQLALLHKGGIVFESDIDNLKTALFKVQVAFSEEYDKSKFDNINTLAFIQKGKVSEFIVRGDREETEEKIKTMNPILFDILPLSLEEVFIYEMDALGYVFDENIKGVDKNEK